MAAISIATTPITAKPFDEIVSVVSEAEAIMNIARVAIDFTKNLFLNF